MQLHLLPALLPRQLSTTNHPPPSQRLTRLLVPVLHLLLLLLLLPRRLTTENRPQALQRKLTLLLFLLHSLNLLLLYSFLPCFPPLSPFYLGSRRAFYEFFFWLFGLGFSKKVKLFLGGRFGRRSEVEVLFDELEAGVDALLIAGVLWTV